MADADESTPGPPLRKRASIMRRSPRFRRMMVAWLLMGTACVALSLVSEYGFVWGWTLSTIALWQVFVFFREVLAAEPHRKALRKLLPQIEEERDKLESACKREDAWSARIHHVKFRRLVDEYREHFEGFSGRPSQEKREGDEAVDD